MVKHFELRLPAFKRGFHLITSNIFDAVDEWPENGFLHIFIQHTSAGLAINENADPSVRVDLENIFNKLVPENQAYYTHTSEGPDDMPAHVKSIFCGSSLSIPIVNKRPALGTWQGIYLCEFRNYGGARKLIVSVSQ